MSKRRLTDADRFIRSLEGMILTAQQKKTLRGQALSGDLEGAMRGLEKIRKQNYAAGHSDVYTKRCRLCGSEFISTANSKQYCSERCLHEANKRRNRRHNEERLEGRHARKAMSKIETGKLDANLAEAKRLGMTYAQWQVEQTIAAVRGGEL